MEPEAGDARGIAWDRMLVWFMRLTAFAWIAKGLAHWASILGIGGGTFESLGPGVRAATVAFAVVDLVAAVGLWLTSAWGGVIWLLALMGEVVVAVLPAGGVDAPVVTLVVDGLLVAIYLALIYLAAREPDEAAA